MPIMNWDKSLDIGVVDMNDDHKEILAVMNAIYDAASQGRTGSAINDLVDKLAKVCVSHFADEEKYMASIAFPGIETHKLIHKKLLSDYAAHAETIKKAGGTTNEDFFFFLKRWLTSHIKGIDIKYADHSRRSAAA